MSFTTSTQDQIFEVTQDCGWKIDKIFRLFVMPDVLCGAYLESSNSLSRSVSAGGVFNSGSGLVDLALMAVVWLFFGMWAWLIDGKRRKRELRLRELDLMSEEFLRDDENNFRLSPHEVERIVFCRKSHFYSRQSFRLGRIQIRLRDGRELNFTSFDAGLYRALGIRLSAVGFTVEGAS